MFPALHLYTIYYLRSELGEGNSSVTPCLIASIVFRSLATRKAIRNIIRDPCWFASPKGVCTYRYWENPDNPMMK